MDPNDSRMRDLLAEHQMLEARLGDRSLYADAAELRRVSERLTELHPAIAAYT
ncbi:hypothetical protein [Nocardia sp. NPDC051832]|uniref:hypothetical protein n=1 Tax=Nocardia sp. NPDC051832 TaxID=3155673 RepID=UPI00343C664B